MGLPLSFTSRAVLVASLTLAACSVELVHGLDEPEANRVVAALSERGVPAETVFASNAGQGTWTVTVPTAEAARARQVLGEAGLPGERVRGLAEVFDGNGLLPTPAEDQARLAQAVQGELTRTLESVPGVVAARVHVSLSEGRRGLDAIGSSPAPASASVLLRFRGAAPPLSEAQIKSLVAGAVEGLSPERVTTVLIRQLDRSPDLSCRLAQLGPLAVSQPSLSPLRLWLGLTTGGLALLALVVIVLSLRSQRFRRRIGELEEALSASSSVETLTKRASDHSGGVITKG